MALEKLSEKDKEIVLQCLNAIAKGNFLEDEFDTRLGLELYELEEVIAAFPNLNDTDDHSNETLVVNNCLNEVVNGINFSEREWQQWFTITKEEVWEVYQKWARLRGLTKTGLM